MLLLDRCLFPVPLPLLINSRVNLCSLPLLVYKARPRPCVAIASSLTNALGVSTQHCCGPSGLPGDLERD